MENTLVKPTAPAPASESVVLVEHGQERVFAYPWLTDQNRGTRVVEHVKAENVFTNESFAQFGIDEVTKQIRNEMLSRLTDSESAIVVDGEWSYYTVDKKDKPAPSHWRFPTKGDKETESQLLFDEAEEAKGRGGQLTLGSLVISDDGELLLISFDTSGKEEYTLQVRRIIDNVVICEVEDIAADAYSNLGPLFNSKGDGLYIIHHDDTQRNSSIGYRVFDRVNGGFISEEVCIYNELDEEFWVAPSISRDRRWVIIATGSSDTSEVFILDRDNPTSSLISFSGRKPGLLFSLDILGDQAHVIADLVSIDGDSIKGGGENNLYVVDFVLDASLIELAPVTSWKKSLCLPSRTILENMELFVTFTAFAVRIDGLQRVMVSPRDAKGIHHFPSTVGNPGKMSAQLLAENPNYKLNSFSIVEKGMQPEDTLLVTLDSNYSNTANLIHTHTYSGLNEKDYFSQMIYGIAPDGEKIPVVVISPIHSPVIGTLLFVYGAYGLSDEIDYVSSWHSLLNRGIACATVYARGGGELGQDWYHAGSLEKKATTMTDTFAGAEAIRKIGFAGVTGKNIVLQGGSAGGAAVGGTVNLDPTVFAGVIGRVPFVDCLNTMLDSTLPLTIGEYSEWGNPTEDKSAWDNIKSWAPTENLKKNVVYPPILATAGLNDPRVGIWEPARWILLLRDLGNQAYLRTVEMAGHAGASDKFALINENAERATFAYWCLTNN